MNDKTQAWKVAMDITGLAPFVTRHERGDGECHVCRVAQADGNVIAEVGGGTRIEAISNAAMVAAAPFWRQALRDISELAAAGDWRGLADIAEAALALENL